MCIRDREKRRNKYQKSKGKIITYTSGEKVLLKNRELPSSLEGITKKLLLLYTGPYIVYKDKNNNTYEIKEMGSGRIKGVYNPVSYTHLDVYKRQGISRIKTLEMTSKISIRGR